MDIMSHTVLDLQCFCRLGKSGKVREFGWSGKGGGKILFLKSRGKMILDHG